MRSQLLEDGTYPGAAAVFAAAAPIPTVDGRTRTADFDPNQPRDPQGRWANEGLTGAGALPTEPAKINQIAAQPGSRSQSPLASVLSFINPISSAAAQEVQPRQTAPVVLAAHIHEKPPEDEEEKQLQEQIRELDDPVRGGPRTRPDGTVSLTAPPPALRRLHPDSTYDVDQSAKGSLAYWRKRSTEEIVHSLRDDRDHLKVKENGTIVQGNTRVKVLEERGFSVDTLPRKLHLPTE